MTMPGPALRLRPAVIVFAVATLVLIHWNFARQHTINEDEGFYLASGLHIAQGLRLYADFFYPQMPYLPYAEAGLFRVTGASLSAGRLLSVVPTALLAGLLAIVAAKRTNDTATAIFVSSAYMLHALSVNYLTIVKTYGLANLFFVSAVLLVTSKHLSVRDAAAAGSCAAIAVGVRLPMVAAALVLFAWSMRAGVRPAIAFAAGAVVASIPVLVIAAQDPQAFWFGNVGFHELRREIVGIGPILTQKMGILAKWIFLPQNLVLWCLAIAGWRRGSARETCALLCAAALGLVYLYATPSYLEYMVQIIPLLLIASIPAAAMLFQRSRLVPLAVCAVYGMSLIVALRPASADSRRALKNELWNLPTVERVVSYLQEQSDPEDRILSWWEGYPVLAGRPGFRDVGFWHSNVGKKLPEDLRRRYHVASAVDVRQLIESKQPRLIVCPEEVWDELRPSIAKGYIRAEVFGRVEVFVRRAAGPTAGGVEHDSRGR
jgi:hypothetical protein